MTEIPPSGTENVLRSQGQCLPVLAGPPVLLDLTGCQGVVHKHGAVKTNGRGGGQEGGASSGNSCSTWKFGPKAANVRQMRVIPLCCLRGGGAERGCSGGEIMWAVRPCCPAALLLKGELVPKRRLG